MRRTLIRAILPLVFCAIPVVAGSLIVVAIPVDAREFYWKNKSPLDQLIVGMGLSLCLAQLIMSWRALQWRGADFDTRADKWLTNLAQAAEWFPLLGLLGTVAGIMQTFDSFNHRSDVPTMARIIGSYAPAITATASGLIMALINIFPTWVVLVGRQIIVALGGQDPAAEPRGSGPER